jgi:hypothetical protein
MKTVISRLLHCGFIPVLMLAAASQSVYAENLNVLGNLQAKGQIQIITGNAPAPVKLTDTTYAYLSGDTIKTGQGSGVLNINDLGRIGLAPGTEASVTKTAKGVNVDLTSGAMAYTLTPGSDFTIQAAGMTLQPSHSPVQKVSTGDEQQMTGWVKIGKDGKVEVGAQSGSIEITRGGTRQVVESGQQSVLQFQGGKLIATQAGGAGGAGAGGGLTGSQILAIVVVAAGGAGAGVSLATSKSKKLASP